MEVTATQSMQQIQTQTRAHKMDGTGGGQGKGGANGMKDIMQNLSSEDKLTLQDQLSQLAPEIRNDVKNQMKQIDGSSLDSSAYLEQLLSVINPMNLQEADSNYVEIYA